MSNCNYSSSSAAASSGGVTIQRLLVVHYKLAEVCTGGMTLGEGASEEELAERIMYYHGGCQQQQLEGVDAVRREAIQFAGLCEALHGIPASIHDIGINSRSNSRSNNNDDADDTNENRRQKKHCEGEGNEDDRTKEVHFENSSLIFVILEDQDDQNIVAVAQIARRRSAATGDGVGGGTPAAVGAALRKSHDLFCLLRGGGIHRRLLSQQQQPQRQRPPDSSGTGLLTSSVDEGFVAGSNSQSSRTDCRLLYGDGMYRLYELRKQIRKLLIERVAGDGDYGTAGEEPEELLLSSLQLELNELSSSELIPIRALKEDLRVHYDAFLADMSSVSDETDGASFRGLVQCVPPPIPTSESGSVNTITQQQRAQLTMLNPYVLAELSVLLRAFLRGGEDSSRTQAIPSQTGLIRAVSIFVHGRFVSTAYRGRNQYDDGHEGIATYTACLLMEYLASFRSTILTRNINNNNSISNGGSPHTGVGVSSAGSKLQRTLRPLAFSLGTGLDDSSPSTSFAASSCSRFLLAPSLSLLSASDKLNDVRGPDDEKVWAPIIALRLNDNTFVDSRICLYDIEELSFLLYLNRSPSPAGDSDDDEDPYFYQSTLRSFDELITENAGSILCSSTDGKPQQLNESVNHRQLNNTRIQTSYFCSREPGQDVIVVDRANQNTTLFLQPKEQDDQNDTSKNGRFRFLRSMSSISSDKSVRSDKSSRDANHAKGQQSSRMLDLRYQLASKLSLDCLLALDDAMAELALRRDSVIQLCTLLPYKWIYAYADSTHEIYAFFDPKLYVTVADVQKAADRVRKELLRGPSLVDND